VVANKFQTGFDEPLLAGMFLDKPVFDRNAVQTVSRLNRSYDDKKDVVVVDFTNNAREILKAFARYRKGTPFPPAEPDEKACLRLRDEILAVGVFTQDDAKTFTKLVERGDSWVQAAVNGFRARFSQAIIDIEQRKSFIYLMARFVKSYRFLTCFFAYPADVTEFAVFAEYVGPQLIKEGNVSELMKHIRETEVIKASVQYQGEVRTGGPVKLKSGTRRKGPGPAPKKVSIQDMIDEIRAQFKITDEEALYIREVTEEKSQDANIRATVQIHKDDLMYLEGPLHNQVNGQIQVAYADRGRYDELADDKYKDVGGIFDIMAITVIDNHLTTAA
jgi:type I restriction enzyme R subunit